MLWTHQVEGGFPEPSSIHLSLYFSAVEPNYIFSLRNCTILDPITNLSQLLFLENTTLHSTKKNIHPATPVIVMCLIQPHMCLIQPQPFQPLPAATQQEVILPRVSTAVDHHHVTGAVHPGMEICSIVTESQVSSLWGFVSSDVQSMIQSRRPTWRANCSLEEETQVQGSRPMVCTTPLLNQG